MRCFLVCVALIAILQPCRQAAAAEADGETSRELELRYRIDPDRRIHVLLSMTDNKPQSLREGSIGMAFDRKLNPKWSWRLGARYIGTSEEADQTSERRAVADLTYKRPLGGSWTVYNRTRTDLRWIDAKPFSYRFRDRLLLERSATVRGHPITAYVSIEAFHDSRYSRLSRGRAVAGVSVECSRLATVDLYYSRTANWLPEQTRLNTLGVALALQFGPSGP